MQRTDHWFITLLLYILGFLLFWEWLRPLAVITKNGDLSVFVMYTAFAFLMSYLQLPFWLTTPAKILAMLYALHSLFFFDSFFDLKWLGYLAGNISGNVGFLFSGNWAQLSDLFRSLLFFVLLWLVSYLMHYWLIQARRVFLFFLVTVLYVTVIDAFTPYDGTAAIVRTVIIGFILLGLLRFIRIQEEERVSARPGLFPVSWISAIIVILLISAAVGFAAPKVKAQWPDPTPFIKSAAQKYDGGKGIQHIGFGTNDTHLGGPFVFNKNPVFTVTTTKRSYWRVTTKSIYTGKGWVTDSNKTVPVNPQKEAIPQLYMPGVTTKTEHAAIQLANGKKFPRLVYGGEIVGTGMPNSVQLMMNPNTEKIMMDRNGNPVSLPSYGITFLVPQFSVAKLEQPVTDPAAIQNRYLQLPKSLPNKVRKLTQQITVHANNRYQKAMAVEQYLHSDAFSYNTKHVAVPGKNQDYVAQFLFDTKRGYCDNFSSAMAVMLRTIGIPTRWVKGFTPGKYQETLGNGEKVYKVTNANAHSWVEVYFPNSGWVPFEPTKGFTNSFNVVQSHTKSSGSPGAKATPKVQHQPKLPHSNNRLNQIHQQQQVHQSGSGNGGRVIPQGWLTPSRSAVILFILLVMAAGAAYRTRKKWLPRLIRSRYMRKNGDHVFSEAYERLLRLLPIYGFARDDNETLREYAATVDSELGTREMKVLTTNYEKARYRGEHSSEMWKDSRELWEMIIKRLMSR